MVWSNSSAHTKTSRRRRRQVGGDENDMFALCPISWEKQESLRERAVSASAALASI
ncbi:Uncharacterized protein APZ42_031061 [Daphnia magna]|uniref:Uncharacterized protein n=1 Tax=Daphnia magna TaxID=35525 RepID=A0A164N6Y6_9CRUS|nr:Uncharacterized protein APZ42_031061 [Daphnia magna]